MKPSNSKTSDKSMPHWLSKVMSHDTLINFFTDYISTSCEVISRDQLENWYTLSPPNKELQPYHFELYHQKAEERNRYFKRSFAKVAHTKKPLLCQHMGFYDYFVPILENNRCVAFLLSGPFSKSIPNLEQLIHQFTKISGAYPNQVNPEFLNYCRVALTVQVLDENIFSVYRNLLQKIALIMSGNIGDGRQVMWIEKIKTSVFSQKIPTRMWNYVATKEDRLRWGAMQLTDLAPWDQSEFRLSRHPTVVIAIMLKYPKAEHYAEVVSMIRATEMQLACFDLVKKIPESITGRMGQEGVYFLTSLDLAWNPVKAKLKIRDMALSIESLLQKKFKDQIFIGVSGLSYSPEELPEAFQESVQVLHLGLSLQKSLIFFEEHYPAVNDLSDVSLYEWAPRLVDACSQAAEKEIPLIREQYIKNAIRLAGKKPENLRIHFLHMLFLLLEMIRKRGLLIDPRVTELRQELMKKFNKSNTITDLLSLFRFHLDLLSHVFQAPSQGERNLRLEQSKEFVSRNFQQPITIKQVASNSGFSVSHFSQNFKRMYGIGFLEHLLQVRCENAKRLLQTTRLPIGHISQECGFRTANHFIQCFKRRLKLTPREYRRKFSDQALVASRQVTNP